MIVPVCAPLVNGKATPATSTVPSKSNCGTPLTSRATSTGSSCSPSTAEPRPPMAIVPDPVAVAVRPESANALTLVAAPPTVTLRIHEKPSA